MLGSPLTRAGLPTALPPQQQRMLADMVENNAQVRLPNTAPQHNTTTAHHPWQPPQAFTQISGLDTLRQRVREYAFKREETRKRLRQTSHPQFAHSPQLAAPSFNPAAFGMPLPKQRPPLAPSSWAPPPRKEEDEAPAAGSAYATAGSSYQPLASRQGAAGRALVPPPPLLHSLPPTEGVRPVRWETDGGAPGPSRHASARLARHEQHGAGERGVSRRDWYGGKGVRAGDG